MIRIITEIITDITKGADALRKGQVVAFPTETVYGLGADAFNGEAVKKIFEAKGRPSDNPLIVHIADIKDTKRITREVPDIFFTLADKFWPGPLTMIVYKSDKVPYGVTAGLDTVGVRMPDNKMARALIRESGCLIAAPSANISGGVSATGCQYVKDDFDGKIPYIIDGGDSVIGLESTVLDLTVSPPMILRPGYITRERLSEVAGEISVHKSIAAGEADIKNPSSPGMKYKHYSPAAEVVILYGNQKNIDKYIRKSLREDECVFKSSDIEGAAAGLYSFMREADKRGIKKIYIPAVDANGLGLAFMNRLEKSSGGKKMSIRKIIFVCTGNTCRSPMAEFLLKKEDIPGLLVESRGLYVPNPSEMNPYTKEVLEERGIPCDGFMSAQFTEAEAAEADRIYTMTQRHKEEITYLYPKYKNKVYTIRECGDVPDPFMLPLEIYENTYFTINEEIKRIGNELRNS